MQFTNMIIGNEVPEFSKDRELNEREREILSTIIQLYILNASPIGSRNLSKYLEGNLKLSPATIRNIMSDLEELNYISHPHTSAGRIPTDKGYRFYVNSLQRIEHLSERELSAINQDIFKSGSETILKDASKVLGMLSHYLAVVRIPYVNDLLVHRIELIQIASDKLLVVIAMDSNIVRTVTLEINFDINTNYIDSITYLINEKVSGKPLSYIRENFINIMQTFNPADTPLIRLFVESIERLFHKEASNDKIHLAGTQNLLNQPEFEDIEKVKGVIELIENEDVIIHLLDKSENIPTDIKVMIGNEMGSQLMEDYSLVVSSYQMTGGSGSIGLIGPKRMNYSKVMALVRYMSELLTIGNK